MLASCQSKGRPTWTETTIASTTREEVAAQAGGQEGRAGGRAAGSGLGEGLPRRFSPSREARIRGLRGQVAEAAKSAEVADALRGEIQQVKAGRPMSASPSRQTWRRSQP